MPYTLELKSDAETHVVLFALYAAELLAAKRGERESVEVLRTLQQRLALQVVGHHCAADE